MKILDKFKKKHFLLLSFLIFFTSLASALTLPFQTLFLYQQLNASESQIGFFVSISSISNIVISFLFAYISDNIGDRRKILQIGLISAVVSYLFYAFARDFSIVVLISATIMGISACITPQLFALSHQLLKQNGESTNEISSNMTLLRTMISISWAFGPLVGSYILEWFDFLGLFLITGLMFFIAFISTSISFKNLKFSEEIKEEKKYQKKKMQA